MASGIKCAGDVGFTDAGSSRGVAAVGLGAAIGVTDGEATPDGVAELSSERARSGEAADRSHRQQRKELRAEIVRINKYEFHLE